jgi:hypothetical protein
MAGVVATSSVLFGGCAGGGPASSNSTPTTTSGPTTQASTSVPTTQASLPTATPETTAAPEEYAPPIAGLHKNLDVSGNVIYLADGTNPYGLKEDAVAGYFNPNVEVQNPDGTATNGAVDLDAKVVQELGVDGLHIPLPIDVGKDARVIVTFDNNGWRNTPRLHLTFSGEALAVSNIIPDSLNTLAVTSPGPGFTWVYASKHVAIDPVTPLTDQTALEDTLVYGQGDSTIDQTLDVITEVPVSFGATYGHVSNSLSISISNGKDSRPVAPLLVGGFSVFLMTGNA